MTISTYVSRGGQLTMTMTCDGCRTISYSVRGFREYLRTELAPIGWRLSNYAGEGYKDWCPNCAGIAEFTGRKWVNEPEA